MTLEEKLKEKAFDLKDNINGFTYTSMLTLSDALTICQQEIDEACKKAKIEEIEKLQAFLAKDASNIIHPSTLFLRKQELNAPSPKESE